MPQPLWSAIEAKDATAGSLLGSKEWSASGVSIDSRTIESGDLFVALQGPNRDAHEFVSAAFKRGAAAAVVSSGLSKIDKTRSYLRVDDTFNALNDLAVAARTRCSGKRIAVTGSVGKTGTKEMLKLVLGAQAKTHASAASYNNLWGVPLTLARMPNDTEFGIFEIGMNHAGEISPLTRLVSPHVAIITTVEPVHLEFFESVEDIADAKAEIFEGLVAPGVAVLAAESQHLQRLTESAKNCGVETLLIFGQSENADIRLKSVVPTATGSAVEANVCGQEVSYRLLVVGRHWVMNSLAVLAAVHAVGADVVQATRSLVGMHEPKGRGQSHHVEMNGGYICVVDESYNANPASMRAAIEALRHREVKHGGRRIVVLGDMLELGEQGSELHASLNQCIRDAEVDLVFLSGPLMKNLWAELDTAVRGEYTATSVELIAPILSNVHAGDTLMVKGSLGSKMGLIVEAIIAQDSVGQRPDDSAKVGGLS